MWSQTPPRGWVGGAAEAAPWRLAPLPHGTDAATGEDGVEDNSTARAPLFLARAIAGGGDQPSARSYSASPECAEQWPFHGHGAAPTEPKPKGNATHMTALARPLAGGWVESGRNLGDGRQASRHLWNTNQLGGHAHDHGEGATNPS